jgi:ribosomal protein RSM22 (predicted rRNA methylase)
MEFSPSELKKAAQALSGRYRMGQVPYLRSPQDRHAYLLTRYPATKAALHRVFQEISSFPIETMLDIGAGPGTSWEAATETWENLKKATLMERDRDFVEIGSKMTPADRVQWITGDVSKQSTFEIHDLVLFSYSWGEILDLALLERAWQATGKFLVVVEPGTPRGYQSMLKARDFCISKKASVFAPCPHSNKCPWQNTSEWCHFGIRLERSNDHRLAKEGSLGFEDEKYSYVILSKEPLETSFSRLLKDPLRRKGHTLITLCSKGGIENQTITKKDKEVYKKINKLKWGDKITNKV